MISAIVSEANGSWSGRPMPSRPVSSRYAWVISAASAADEIPRSSAGASIFSLTSVMFSTSVTGWPRHSR